MLMHGSSRARLSPKSRQLGESSMTSGSSTHSSIPRFDNDGETPISPGITLYSINTSSTRTFVNDDNVDEKDGLGDIDKPKYNSRSRAYFVKGAHKKSIRKAPWVTLPVRGTEDIWIEKDQEAVEWLSLFYGMSTFDLCYIVEANKL